METRQIYCSGCDREVRVLVRHEPRADAATDPSAFVCLDCGTTCTGSLCPLTEAPPPEMRARLAALRSPD